MLISGSKSLTYWREPCTMPLREDAMSKTMQSPVEALPSPPARPSRLDVLQDAVPPPTCQTDEGRARAPSPELLLLYSCRSSRGVGSVPRTRSRPFASHKMFLRAGNWYRPARRARKTIWTERYFKLCFPTANFIPTSIVKERPAVQSPIGAWFSPTKMEAVTPLV